jgi:hypothetical protein
MTGIEKLRYISTNDLAILGMTDVAYIKGVKGEDGTVYEIHAEYGTPDPVVN